MDRVIPVVDGYLALINLRPVDSGQDVVIELLALVLGVGRVSLGVGEQVHGEALAIPLRPEQVPLHPGPDMGWDWEQVPNLGPETGPIPPSLGFVAPKV